MRSNAIFYIYQFKCFYSLQILINVPMILQLIKLKGGDTEWP
jgi:hypothetical protein